jgi:hypothetical protein
LPRLEPEIVKHLKQKLPPIEFNKQQTKDAFFVDAVFRAGQRDVIAILEKILEDQEK